MQTKRRQAFRLAAFLFKAQSDLAGSAEELDFLDILLGLVGAQLINSSAQTNNLHKLIEAVQLLGAASDAILHDAGQAAVIAEERRHRAVAAPVATEHDTQSCANQLGDIRVTNDGHQVGVESLDISSGPDRSGNRTDSLDHAAADDISHLVLCNNREVCRHHHNELLPSNE
jgi:hypothetical protein